MKPSKQELAFFDFASMYVNVFPKLKMGSIVERYKDCPYHIQIVEPNFSSPTRVSGQQDRIEVNPIAFKKTSKDMQLLTLLWCFYKRNNGKIEERDTVVDVKALKLYLSRKKIKSPKQFYISFVKMFSNPSLPVEYSKKRILNLKTYMLKLK